MAQDVRYATRLVRSRPGFVLAVSVTLALGIGATAAMFGVFDRLLLRPPAHLAAAGDLRRVYVSMTIPGLGERTTSRAGYVVYLARYDPSFERVRKHPGFQQLLQVVLERWQSFET